MKKATIAILILTLAIGTLGLASEKTKVPLSAIEHDCYNEIDISKAEFFLSEVGKECVIDRWLNKNGVKQSKSEAKGPAVEEKINTEFELSNLRVEPRKDFPNETNEIYDHKPFVLKVDIKNVGEESGNYTADFYVNGNHAGSDTVKVGSGETETASVVGKRKAGKYTVEVGTESTDFEVLKSPEVVTVGVRDISYENATLVGELREAGDIDLETATYRMSCAHREINEPREFQVEIGLEPNTEHTTKAVVFWEDKSGNEREVSGEKISFTTPPGARVETLGATNVTDEKATLHGKLEMLAGLEEVSAHFGYTIQGEDDWGATPVGKLSEEGIFNTNLRGLKSDTEYYFKAQVEWEGEDERKFDEANTLTFRTAEKNDHKDDLDQVFEIDDLEVSPKKAEPGEKVEVILIITNVDYNYGEQEIKFYVNTNLEDSKLVELKSGASEEITFQIERSIKTDYDIQVNTGYDTETSYFEVVDSQPAEFEVSSLSINPARILPKEKSVISSQIINTGTKPKKQEIKLKVDGEVEKEKIIELEGKESRDVNFDLSFQEEGIFKVTVDTGDDYKEGNISIGDAYRSLELKVVGEGGTNLSIGTWGYKKGEEVTIKAEPGNRWQFSEWKGDLESRKNEVTVTMDEDKKITAKFEIDPTPIEISDWYDLDKLREYPQHNFVLVNDLDDQTPGYDELVDKPHGWNPIGEIVEDTDPTYKPPREVKNGFSGHFDGRNNKIEDLYIDRPTNYVGLFRVIKGKGLVENLEISGEVIGRDNTGGLTGIAYENSRISGVGFHGEVTGIDMVGGLAGWINDFSVARDSYSTARVTGNRTTGGLAGYNRGKIFTSFATGEVTDEIFEDANYSGSFTDRHFEDGEYFGGLIGRHF